MQKVIAYQDRAEEWQRRASEATKAQEREADERMAAVWESLAEERKAAQRAHYPAGLLVDARMNECPCLEGGRWALLCKVSRNTLLSGRYGSPELIEFVRASLPQATSV